MKRTHKNRKAWMMSLPLALWLAVASGGRATEYFVDQSHPSASDSNPGTEALPLKTIQGAVNKTLAPGDTIWVKAGVYDGTVSIYSKFGRIDAPITLSAWSNDQVRIGSILQDAPGPGSWTNLPGSKSWGTQLAVTQATDMIVFIDEHAVPTEKKDTPPADSQVYWATYRAADRQLMINIGGDNPAYHHLKLARFYSAIGMGYPSGYWAFKNLEFGWLALGLSVTGPRNLVEDCYFHHTVQNAIHPHCDFSRFSRCTFYKCGYAISASGSGPHNVFEDLLVIGSGQNLSDDVSARLSGDPNPLMSVTFKGEAFSQVFRNNIIADSIGGLYYDIYAESLRIIDNGFWEIEGSGGWNEFSDDDTLWLGNYFYYSTFLSSWCCRVSLIDNFFEFAPVHWFNRDRWPLVNAHMVLRGNAFVNGPSWVGYLSAYGAVFGYGGWGPLLYTNGFANCLVDYNRVRMYTNAVWVREGTNNLYSLAEVQSKYGWEKHGEGGIYDPRGTNDLTPAAMGGSAFTCRTPWGLRRYWARPILADGTLGTWPGSAEMGHPAGAPSFFWRVADGNYDPQTLWPSEPWRETEFLWQPSVVDGENVGTNKGCQWYVDAENTYPPGTGLDYSTNLVRRVEYSIGNRWLAVKGITPAQMPASGVGYWSPWLSAPGETTNRIAVSLKMKGAGLTPNGTNTAAVWMEFRNQTGRDLQRKYLVGVDDQGQTNRGALLSGTYGWTTVSTNIVAPTGAVRMALFMGLKPSQGEVGFDDADIQTESEPLPDLVYYIPFQDYTTNYMNLNVYDGKSNVVQVARLYGCTDSWMTTNTPSGAGWARDLRRCTNHTDVGPALFIPGAAGFSQFNLVRTNDEITIAAWILFYGYDQHPGVFQGLVNNARTSNGSDGWCFVLASNAPNPKLAFWIANGGARYSSGTVPIGQWTHVAMTWKAGATNPVFYVNGTDSGSTGDDLSQKVATPMKGNPAASLVISLSDAFLPGNLILDEFRVYKRVLSAAEVYTLSQTK